MSKAWERLRKFLCASQKVRTLRKGLNSILVARFEEKNKFFTFGIAELGIHRYLCRFPSYTGTHYWLNSKTDKARWYLAVYDCFCWVKITSRQFVPVGIPMISTFWISSFIINTKSFFVSEAWFHRFAFNSIFALWT